MGRNKFFTGWHRFDMVWPIEAIKCSHDFWNQFTAECSDFLTSWYLNFSTQQRQYNISLHGEIVGICKQNSQELRPVRDLIVDNTSASGCKPRYWPCQSSLVAASASSDPGVRSWAAKGKCLLSSPPAESSASSALHWFPGAWERDSLLVFVLHLKGCVHNLVVGLQSHFDAACWAFCTARSSYGHKVDQRVSSKQQNHSDQAGKWFPWCWHAGGKVVRWDDSAGCTSSTRPCMLPNSCVLFNTRSKACLSQWDIVKGVMACAEFGCKTNWQS